MALAFDFDTQAPQMLEKCRTSLLRILAENRSSSSQCRSLLGFQTLLFISDCFGCNFWLHSEPCSECSCIQNHVLNALAFRTVPEPKRFQVFAPSSEVAVLTYRNLSGRPFLVQVVEKLTTKTSWSGGRVQVCLQVRAPGEHLAITPKGYSRTWRQSKSMAKLFGHSSTTGWAGWTGKYKHMASPSRQQPLLASTGSLEEKVLPFLRYWLISRVEKVFNAVTGQWLHFLFWFEMKFWWISRKLVDGFC